MRIVSWNIRYSTEESTQERIRHLEKIDWDLLALQEVSRAAWKAFQNSEFFQSGQFTLAAFGLRPPGPRKHGVAVISRVKGIVVSSPRLIPKIPKAERGLSVTIEGYKEPFSLVSGHAPNAASEGELTKMLGYQGFTDWLISVDKPCVACFDGNHWNVRTELHLPDPPERGSKFYAEDLFFSNASAHDYEDVYLKYLSNSPEEYKRILQEMPDGPLAVSYVRKGSGKTSIKDRFDYIFASPQFRVQSCEYEYRQAVETGSDHGMVIADLDL